ncbi:MAG: hydrogenase nickel incorporation protein HypA [Phycisphaerae bacterium]|nr:hydrogenase nickel incorporation protein HypA [Phycisphaerae bacterium]
MHESAIAQNLVDMAASSARAHGASRVTCVRCRVGTMRQLDEAMLRDAFELVAQGGPCANATLAVEQLPLRAACVHCGVQYGVEGWQWACPVCGRIGAVEGGGDELELVSIDAEVEP